MKIGVISDTHGTFDAALESFLAPCDEIWHAGDIGSLELADRISAFRPLRAVYGNIDGGIIRRVYHEFNYFEAAGATVLMTPATIRLRLCNISMVLVPGYLLRVTRIY